MRARRTEPEIRKKQILDAAIRLSRKIGYNRITRDAIAETAKVSSPLIANYFPRMSDIKRAVMDTAIEQEIVEIIAQGLVLKDRRALQITGKIKTRVLTYLSNL